MRKLTVALAVAGMAGAMWLTSGSGQATAAPAETGAKIYASKCAGCHGQDGSGNIAAAPDFTSAEWQGAHSDAELMESIKNGKGRMMPAWGSKLTEEQIGDLVKHVRSLKK